MDSQPKFHRTKAHSLLSAGVAACAVLFAGCNTTSQSEAPKVAGFDQVTLGGELNDRLQRNFDRLETEYYQPAQVYWSEAESGGWPADKEGRTILALTLDAQATHRTPKYLDTLIQMLPSKLNAKGYLGSIHEGMVDEQQLSGHGWLLRGLCEYYAWKRDPKVLEEARTIVDSLFLPIAPFVSQYPLSSDERVAGVGEMSGSVQNTVNGWRLSSDIGCVFIGMEGLIHSYQYVPSDSSKALIEQMIALFKRMDLVKIKAQTHASLTALRGMLRWATLSGDTTLIPEVETRWALYKAYGMTENYENYNWFERYDTWTEPCAIVDSYLVAVQLWQATGNAQYLEDAEKIYYNGMGATQRANGGFGCDRPTGVVFPDLAIHADEAYWCCTMRGGEGLGRAAEYTYFTQGDTVIVPFYRESTLSLPDAQISLEQHTDYPFGNQVSFVFTQAPSHPIGLRLSTPSYMHAEQITLNGETSLQARFMQGFLTVCQSFQAGDTLTFRYAFEPTWVPLENQDIKDKTLYKAMYGPLVLGYEADAPLELAAQEPIIVHDGTFRIESCNQNLQPLYHHMDSTVSSAAGYHRMVSVKIAQ
ncbi:MAG: glycoside hydrolase family 127 protein [Alistipes sp.]|nr:glycoside hydrolase family 127 protein [Alistipes sp.]